MKVEEFASLLFEIEVNTHIMHLQTTSFAQHSALNTVYQDIVNIRDRFIESYQGEYGIIKGYKNIQINEGSDPYKYIQECCKKIYAFQETLQDSYLKQIVDDAHELLYSAEYKLKFLK